jgi:hypothetical protein
MDINIIPYIAIITAIVAGYFTYINQLRLKTFEILYTRKTAVLTDIEEYLKNLCFLQAEIEKEETSEALAKYLREHFHEGLILFHKVKGANFGGVSDIMADTFWSIVCEPSTKGTMTKDEAKSWLSRTINGLSALYGFSHRQLTKELEEMAFSSLSIMLRNNKRKVKSENKS